MMCFAATQGELGYSFLLGILFICLLFFMAFVLVEIRPRLHRWISRPDLQPDVELLLWQKGDRIYARERIFARHWHYTLIAWDRHYVTMKGRSDGYTHTVPLSYVARNESMLERPCSGSMEEMGKLAKTFQEEFF